MGSADSPVQKAFNIASSSIITALFLIVGLIAATIACLPILLLLKVSSVLFSSWSSQEHVDSSLQPHSAATEIGTSSFAERLLINLIGDSSLSCTRDGALCENQCVAPMLSYSTL